MSSFSFETTCLVDKPTLAEVSEVHPVTCSSMLHKRNVCCSIRKEGHTNVHNNCTVSSVMSLASVWALKHNGLHGYKSRSKLQIMYTKSHTASLKRDTWGHLPYLWSGDLRGT